MSAPTASKRERKHSGSGLTHHVRTPYGLLIIGGFLFLAAWVVWTFFLSARV